VTIRSAARHCHSRQRRIGSATSRRSTVRLGEPDSRRPARSPRGRCARPPRGRRAGPRRRVVVALDHDVRAQRRGERAQASAPRNRRFGDPSGVDVVPVGVARLRSAAGSAPGWPQAQPGHGRGLGRAELDRRRGRRRGRRGRAARPSATAWTCVEPPGCRHDLIDGGVEDPHDVSARAREERAGRIGRTAAGRCP
jgi:hypothetical protein